MALAIGFKRSLAGIAAVGALLSITAADCAAKNTSTGPRFGTKKHNKKPRPISVKLETRSTAFQQEIRYWIGKNPGAKDPPTFRAQFTNTQFVRYVSISPGEMVLFHAENKEKRTTHVRCVITYRKKIVDDGADPDTAICYYRVPG